MKREAKNFDEKSADNLRRDSSKIKCNLCKTPFHPHTMFERFCSSCRKSSRVFKLSEWLPEHAITF